MDDELKKLREINLKETKEKLRQIPEDKILIKKYREKDDTYKWLARKTAPNLTSLLGEELTAGFITAAKSLKKLAFMASSKIQILGAEAALFRHLKEHSNPPKHGIIYKHNSVKEAENKGKAARQLAAKISLSAKKDYFKTG